MYSIRYEMNCEVFNATFNSLDKASRFVEYFTSSQLGKIVWFVRI